MGEKCGEQRERLKLGVLAFKGALTLPPKLSSFLLLSGPLPTCFYGPQTNQPHPHPRPLPQIHDHSTLVTGVVAL